MNIKKYWWLWALSVFGVTAFNYSHGQPPVGNEYSIIGYDAEAKDNPIARLISRLESGEVELQYQGPRGYLDSLLEALNIDPSSQTLIFSKTSLQYPLIDAKTPRAVYFNDDTYIGWVQNSHIVEVTTIDAKLGIIFYVFNNPIESNAVDSDTRGSTQYFDRATQSCLVCHDSYGMMGGGVPQVLARSSIYSINNSLLLDVSGAYNVSDQTPIKDRWGGWYVTGQHGKQTHLGNIQLQGPDELKKLNKKRQGNLDTLKGFGVLDTEPYLTATSDIVALMVFEHQLAVQNQITYVMFKAPAVLERIGQKEATLALSWEALPPKAQSALTRMLDRLVQRLFMVDTMELKNRIRGSQDYETWFNAQGPHDKEGRSLRELDLKKRLFKYQLSYSIYSESFDSLPVYAKDYVYQKIAAILEGRDNNEAYKHLSATERRTILEILMSTKVEFPYYMDAVR